MAITFVTGASASALGSIVYGSPIILTLTPGLIQAGDLLFAQFGGSDLELGTTAWITEAGWYPLTNKCGRDDTDDQTALGLAQYVFYKIATSSEPASYHFTPSTNQSFVSGIAGALSVWRGADTASPILAFSAVSNGLLSSAHPSPSLSVSTPVIPLPIANAQAILFGFTTARIGNIVANEIATGQVHSPAGSTVRYTSLGETDNGAAPPGTQRGVSQSLECANIAVTGSATASYTWTSTYTDTSAPSGSVTQYIFGITVVIREAANADPVTWAVRGNPSLVNQPVNLYTEQQQGILLSPNNSDNLYTIYGSIQLSLRMVIARYSRSLGTVQATAVFADYPIVQNAPMPFAISNDDNSLYWVSAFESTSPDGSSGRVYRYDTATLTQQTTSDWLPDDDAAVALRVGTPGKWSADLLFCTSGFYGAVPHGVYVLDPTTLALILEIPYTDFYAIDSNGVFTDMTVDCDGNAWVLGTEGKLFSITEGYAVTVYDVSVSLPNNNGVIGLHPRLDALMIGNTNGVSIWDITTHATIATYTMPAYAASLQALKSSFMSQSVGITNAGLWVSFLVLDRVPIAGDGFYDVAYCYFQKLNEDTLAVEATYVVPMGAGILQYDSLALDTGVAPYRLWGWGKYPAPKFDPEYFLAAAPTWFTTPQVLADEWAPGGNGTQQQLVHGRGFNYMLPVTADVPTAAGTGSRVCAMVPVTVPILTCFDLSVIDGENLVVLHGSGLATTVRVVVSPYNNPYDGNAIVPTILSITDTEIVVTLSNSSNGKGYWFVFLANGTVSAGTNTPCVPFATSPWKTRKVWFASLEP